MDRHDSSRRDFLKQTSLGVGAATFSVAGKSLAAANSQVRVGLIGCGGRGPDVAQEFNKLVDVRVTHVCDVHEQRLAEAARKLSIAEGKAVGDLRQILDSPEVDAVYIATPDHWHAPASILACEAKKHVYVEKPCSHNLREGRMLIDAARRNNRVVQHGTQVRSTPLFIEAVEMLRDGIIGEIMVCRAWNVQKRRSIGHGKPSKPPAELDYDTWIGPAPMEAYRENCVDGWHWRYSFGTGGIGNDGIHDIDYARWGLGVTTHPTRISAAGGKYFFDDDQEFPDTHQVSFEYPGNGEPGNQKLFIYEQRLWSTNYPSVYNVDSGVEYYGTKGRMFLSRRGKIQVLDARNRRQDISIEIMGQDTAAHVANFIGAIRDDRRPSGDIEIGHLTASLCHLGNLSVRLGRSIQLDPDTEQVIGDDEANRWLGREYRDHWATPTPETV